MGLFKFPEVIMTPDELRGTRVTPNVSSYKLFTTPGDRYCAHVALKKEKESEDGLYLRYLLQRFFKARCKDMIHRYKKVPLSEAAPCWETLFLCVCERERGNPCQHLSWMLDAGCCVQQEPPHAWLWWGLQWSFTSFSNKVRHTSQETQCPFC